MNHSFDELYHPSGGTDSSGYDNLNRLTSFSRGTLTHTNASNSDPSGRNLPDTVASPSKTQTWLLDAQGNWTSFSTNGTAQTRAFNTRNQITSISGATVPTYDSNGNTTTDDQGKKYKFDAWNRLAEVDNGAGSALEYLRYLADGSRGAATTTDPCNGGTTDSYYSVDSRDIEDKFTLPPHGCCGGSTTISTYAWGEGYENALISRDQTGTRLFAQQDANWDVTSEVNTSGTVAQRIEYDPYGSATFLTAAWGSSSNLNSWLYTWQGGKLDTIDGLIHFGTPGRDYSTTLGRWMEVDAALYIDGPNAYQAMSSNPASLVDPLGLAASKLPNPGSPNWGPIDPTTGQPKYLPKIPGGWKPVPNPKFNPADPHSRPGKWVPADPKAVRPKGSKGGLPSGSWDPRGSGHCPNGHGDYDDGLGNRGHVDENGNPITPDQAHNSLADAAPWGRIDPYTRERMTEDSGDTDLSTALGRLTEWLRAKLNERPYGRPSFDDAAPWERPNLYPNGSPSSNRPPGTVNPFNVPVPVQPGPQPAPGGLPERTPIPELPDPIPVG